MLRSLLLVLFVSGLAAGDAPSKPAWATAVGKDASGSWADLALGPALQRFRWIPPGSFASGLTDAEKQALIPPQRAAKRQFLCIPAEPRRQVTLTRGFWLADSVVTRGQWRAVMGTSAPEHEEQAGGDDLPKANLAWTDCQAFLGKLGKESMIPSEAQWEHACRAGSTGPAYGALADIAWYAGNSGGMRHPVRQKQANAWGLYDMLGNACQWCADFYEPYPADAVIDPTGPANPVPDKHTGLSHVIRGSNFGYQSWDCQVGNRGGGVATSWAALRLAFPAVAGR